jgi:hypothetical protein
MLNRLSAPPLYRTKGGMAGLGAECLLLHIYLDPSNVSIWGRDILVIKNITTVSVQFLFPVGAGVVIFSGDLLPSQC